MVIQELILVDLAKKIHIRDDKGPYFQINVEQPSLIM